MHGVNYRHVRISGDLNLHREDMGNKTTEREDEPLNLVMTNFWNYNGPKPKKAFAEHSDMNTLC